MSNRRKASTSQKNPATSIELTIIGKDRKGVVASFTNAIFRNGGNIESINQNVVKGLFGMHLEASFSGYVAKSMLSKEFKVLGKETGMEVGIHIKETGRRLNLAILVTKEPHCFERILDSSRQGDLRANICVVIGTELTLKSLAVKNNIPFHEVGDADLEQRESKTLDLLQKYNADVIALARYMRILSPNFVWRYPNKIINVHPSLLPAFPGAYAYEQAFERGAKVIGCTAHFVTMDLDEGPIIWQESFKVRRDESLASIRNRGRALEAKALLTALRLYSKNRLEVRWGRVYTRP